MLNNLKRFPKKTIFFLHIPKCAGTTLTEEIIKSRYSAEQLLIFYHHGTETLINDLKAMPLARQKKIRCIAGHFAFGIHNYFTPRPIAYITILRDPIERVISHYYYILRCPKHPYYEKITSNHYTLKDYVEKFQNMEMDNGQTRILAGIGWGGPFGGCSRNILDKARENLDTHFAAVGISERFDDFLAVLSFLFDWDIKRYTPRNITEDRAKKEELDRDTLEAIIKYNQLDMELYEYAKRRFSDQFDGMARV